MCQVVQRLFQQIISRRNYPLTSSQLLKVMKRQVWFHCKKDASSALPGK